MSLHFSANQYERNFKPTLLQNWEVPRRYRERPRAFVGFTQIVASNKGHLLPGVKRSRESPWGTFVGTYDMPLKIPGNSMTNCTARTENAVLKLDRIKSDGDIVIKGKLKRCNIPSPLPVKADKDADKTLGAPDAYMNDTNQEKYGSGYRSGAHAPIPATTVPQGSPGMNALTKSPVEALNAKPSTPNIAWPRPASQTSKRSATPVKSPLPAIISATAGTPAPRQPGDIRWPSPRAEEAIVPPAAPVC